VEKIRVLVANRPRLMRELVLATIADQPDIEIMGEIKDDSELVPIVAESHPDFVIIALDKPEERPAVCNELLGLHPQVKILALAPERNCSVFFWAVVVIQSIRIESSEEGILNALRGKGPLVVSERVN
jgi:DNA-binding NarL/FixJ family response regulator